MKRLLLALAVLATAGLAYWATRAGERSPASTAPGAGRGTAPAHVLLVTIDTLRADRLGSYGWADARTPVLDALARRGVRFARAYASAPITLTSHATILTGRYPPGHGGRHNGVAMRAEPPVLAARLKEAGFHTAAFVSAFPLDRRFGLARGFDVYDDELPRAADGRPANERPGSLTIDRALAWLRSRPAPARLFVWVHLFEPHAPYGTPAAGGASASQRYDGEIATADREIGRLLDAWPALDRTLVVATADHGEAFGEHGETGHSIFVYDATLHVPLIVAGPGAIPGAVIDAPVTLADLAPTIAGWLGVPALDPDGIDVRPLLDGVPPASRALYAESFAPLLDFGWAPLRSLRRDGLKVIAAPRPELYDLAADPNEERNVIEARSDVARGLLAQVDRISGPSLPAGPTAADPDALARLRALGYAGGGAGPADGARPDPKDRIDIASSMAEVTSGELQGPAAERALADVLRKDPGNVQAHLRLGYLLSGSARCPQAEPHFEAAIAAGLPSADAHLGLALCLARRGARADALAALRAGRGVEPGNPVVDANIGLLELESDRVGPAIEALRAALARDADLHEARFALARALARAGDREAARREATVLLERLPGSAPQRREVERLLAALR
jgi:arylsulfatase A-like enzyme/Tfp pilus assembly protein PilF